MKPLPLRQPENVQGGYKNCIEMPSNEANIVNRKIYILEQEKSVRSNAISGKTDSALRPLFVHLA